MALRKPKNRGAPAGRRRRRGRAASPAASRPRVHRRRPGARRRQVTSTLSRSRLRCQEANGDLLVFSNALLTTPVSARNDLAGPSARMSGARRRQQSRASIDEELVVKIDEQVARTHKVMPIAEENGTHRALRRRSVAVAPPAGRVGHRSTLRLEGVGLQDGHVDHRADVPLDGRPRSASSPRSQPRTRSGRKPRRSRGQPRRPGAGGAARGAHRQPGAARPQRRTSTSNRSTTGCGSDSASTVTSSRRSPFRCRRTTR